MSAHEFETDDTVVVDWPNYEYHGTRGVVIQTQDVGQGPDLILVQFSAGGSEYARRYLRPKHLRRDAISRLGWLV